MTKPDLLLGADGCPGGWMVATALAERVWIQFSTDHQLGVLLQLPRLSCAVIDIPIGLSARAPRTCDVEARLWLGWPRGSSVFPAPIRPALDSRDYLEALATTMSLTGKGCSRQSYNLLGKVRAIDLMLRPEQFRTIHEGHPELAFKAMTGVVLPSKKTGEGRRLRTSALEEVFGSQVLAQLESFPQRQEDCLDAFSCLWVAKRLAAGLGQHFPVDREECDARGIPMQIWY